MIEQIKTVLLELGKGFSFVGNQYRISTPNDYLIDLLFYSYEVRNYLPNKVGNLSLFLNIPRVQEYQEFQ